METPTTAASMGKLRNLPIYNYARWRRDVEFFLQAESALLIVLEDEVDPGGRRAADFQCRSGKAAAIINASCHSSIKTYIDGMRDPAQMWAELKSKLDTANTRAGRTAILSHFHQLCPVPNTTITEYITKLLECRQQLEASEQAISDETFLTHLITTLPSECNSIVDIIMHQPVEHQTIDYVITTLVEWETSVRNRRREVGSGTMAASTMMTGNVLVLVKGQNNFSYGRWKWNPQRLQNNYTNSTGHSTDPSSSVVRRWFCNKRGHKQNNCW